MVVDGKKVFSKQKLCPGSLSPGKFQKSSGKDFFKEDTLLEMKNSFIDKTHNIMSETVTKYSVSVFLQGI